MKRRARTPVGQGVLTFDVRRRLKRAGIADKKPKAAKRSSGDASRVLEAVRAELGTNEGGLALLDRVHARSGLPLDAFQRELDRLYEARLVGLHFHDFPADMSPALRAASLKRGGTFFHAAYLRKPPPPAPAPAPSVQRLRVLIVPASDRLGIEGRGFYVVSPVGRMYRETLESARLTAELQAAAHGTTVDESEIRK